MKLDPQDLIFQEYPPGLAIFALHAVEVDWNYRYN
jgi:hypothetical protein